MPTKATDDLIEGFSKIVGAFIVGFGLICLRAWLVGICASLFFPDFTLSFWNWVLVVVTFRFVIATDSL